MDVTEMIATVTLSLISIGSLIISYCQFHERGFLFNNSYLYASKKNRSEMDKKPYYRQSGVIFALISVLFFINAIEINLKTGWLIYVVFFIVFVMILYAAVSTIRINKMHR